MNTRWSRALLLTMLYLAYDHSAAEAQTCRGTVIFGNGIWTTMESARWSARQLKSDLQNELIRQGLPSLEDSCFGLAYAVKDSGLENLFGLGDLIESASQITSGDFTQFWHWWDDNTSDPALDGALSDAMQATKAFEYAMSPELVEHIAGYEAIVQSGSRLILVAHSQGNLFANAAFTAMVQPAGSYSASQIAVVPVATPAHYIPGPFAHITLQGDVILSIALLQANTASDGTPCVPNPLNPSGLPGLFNAKRCHSFRDSYLIGTFSRASVLGNILSALPSAMPVPDARFRMTSGTTTAVHGHTLSLTALATEHVDVTLDAGLSSDPVGSVVAWEWTVDGVMESTATALSQSFAQRIDPYEVSLIVVNDRGIRSQPAVGHVSVRAPLPEARLLMTSGSSTASNGQTLNLAIASSRDLSRVL